MSTMETLISLHITTCAADKDLHCPLKELDVVKVYLEKVPVRNNQANIFVAHMSKCTFLTWRRMSFMPELPLMFK